MIKTETYAGPVQILANVELQYSVTAEFSQGTFDTVKVTKENGRVVVPAGTPVVLTGLQDGDSQDIVAAEVSGDKTANAVSLHEVDITSGVTGSAALLVGIVNLARLDPLTADALLEEDDNLKQITLVHIA